MVWTPVRPLLPFSSVKFSRLDIRDHLAMLASHEGPYSVRGRVRTEHLSVIRLDAPDNSTLQVGEGDDLGVILSQIFGLDMIRPRVAREIGVASGDHSALPMRACPRFVQEAYQGTQ